LEQIEAEWKGEQKEKDSVDNLSVKNVVV